MNGKNKSLFNVAGFCFALALLVACANEKSVPELAAQKAGPGMVFYHGSLDQAIKEAKLQEKLVFVDFWTDWCGPCLVMQKEVFPLPEVGEYFNQRFINVEINAEDESINGPELARRFGVSGYPTYVILDTGGNEIGRATNAMSGEQFIALASQMLGESESRFAELQARLDAGERDPDFLKTYLYEGMVQMGAGLVGGPDEIVAIHAVAAEYFAQRDPIELTNAVDADLLFHFWDKAGRGDDLVEFVLNHYDEFKQVSSEFEVSDFAISNTWFAALRAARAGDESFLSYIEGMSRPPMTQAVAFRRKEQPDSTSLPEPMRERLTPIYLSATEQWPELHGFYQALLEEMGSTATPRNYLSAGRALSRSASDEYQAIGMQYLAEAWKQDNRDAIIAAEYYRALKVAGSLDAASRVEEEFRNGMSDSEVDQRKLIVFKRVVDASEKDPDSA